ncbi:hypothetical protein FOZ60_013234 [Perkinsus olseni]|uniref:C2H2-type domain-containing protein n=1 Tax=Perkinsus olseni TaxID=32597 RepID=A0A7J6NA31_PEROL|nr:hypothetical protein FOZ60_013234 [Perkinsus olseni]
MAELLSLGRANGHSFHYYYFFPISFRKEMERNGFLKKAHLDRHVSSVHTDDRPYQCPMCPKTFKRASHLKRHEENAHSIEKNEICEKCGKAFGGSEQLRRHLKRHRVKAAHASETLSVASIMSRKAELVADRRVEEPSKEPDHRCEKCGKSFTRLRGLRLHMRSKHHRTRGGEVVAELPSFPCHLCGLEFSTGSNRNAHMRVKHPGGTPTQFKCSRCGFESPYRHVVVRHEKNVHDGGGAKRRVEKEDSPVVKKACRFDTFGRMSGPSSLFMARIPIGVGSGSSDSDV